MNLLLKPVDVCYFRDSKPFSRGSEHFAKSIFPPNLSTVYGALRTFLIEKNNISIEDFKTGNIKDNSLKELLGSPSETGNLKVKGVFLNRLDDTLVKCPLDLFEAEQKNKPLDLIEPEFAVNSSGFRDLPFIKESGLEQVADKYISLDALNKYLTSECENIQLTVSEHIISKENRTGIGIDYSTNIVKTGMLYTVEAITLKDNYQLVIYLENIENIEDNDVINLGGGHRKFIIKTKSNDFFSSIEQDKIKEKIKQTKQFKLLFLTPAIFKNGWLPENLEKNILEFDDIKIELISAVIGRPKKIGGFDMAERKPKSMYNALPEASIYYFKILNDINDETINKIFNRFYLKNISEIYSEMGFGLTILGGI